MSQENVSPKIEHLIDTPNSLCILEKRFRCEAESGIRREPPLKPEQLNELKDNQNKD